MIISQNGLKPTPDTFIVAENGLLEQCGGHGVFWAGRAATLLYASYLLAKQKQSGEAPAEVIVPAVMCATAANTALMAGLTPRFADINSDGVITLETIRARKTPQTVAVVVIHLLGNVVELDEIAAWCREQDIMLIEDPTQAVGGHYKNGNHVGSMGDLALYSFNRTKILDVGNGALVTKSVDITEQLCAIIDSIGALSCDQRLHQRLSLSYRNLHHAFVDLLRLNSTDPQLISDTFMRIRHLYMPLYLRPTVEDVDLNSAWTNLDDRLAHRLHLAQLYADALHTSPYWTLLTGFENSGVCWRFSLLLHNSEQQVAFSEAVRQDGFHVSNLYWAVNDFFYPSDQCPQAASFARRIVNLWVDHSVDSAYVRACCESLLKHQILLQDAREPS